MRFYQALRKHITDHGYDLGVLVAFSGDVTLNGDPPVTEARLNGFPDTQTAEKFDTDEYQIMVVAEKFQTGFDQPKLYAMYVDKTLTGLAAVQTLSRLNRTHPDKDGTFVLDFVNDAEAIADEFEQYHGKTVAPPSDPNLLYDTRHALDEFGVLDAEEARTFAHLLLAEDVDHGRLHAALGPAIDRFADLEDDEQDRFRDALSRFVRIYSFLSQIVSFGDTDLERDYLFAKALAAFIKADPGETVDLSGAVELTHLRHEKQFEGSVALEAEEGEAVTIYSGTGKLPPTRSPKPLSVIIDRLNAMYGTDWSDADRLVFDAALEDMVADENVQVTAANNTPGELRGRVPRDVPEGAAGPDGPQREGRLQVPRRPGPRRRRGQGLRHPRPGRRQGRLPGALPDRGAARRRARARTWSTSPPCAPAPSTGELMQGPGDRGHQDRRRVRQQPPRRHPAHRGRRRRHRARPGQRLRHPAQGRQGRPRPVRAPPQPGADQRPRRGRRQRGQHPDPHRRRPGPVPGPRPAQRASRSRRTSRSTRAARWSRRPPSTSASATAPARSPTPAEKQKYIASRWGASSLGRNEAWPTV